MHELNRVLQHRRERKTWTRTTGEVAAARQSVATPTLNLDSTRRPIVNVPTRCTSGRGSARWRVRWLPHLLAGVTALCFCSGGVADIKKVFHIRNPFPDDPQKPVNDMHVLFTQKIDTAPHGVGQGRTEYPSDQFDGASYTSGKPKVDFAGGELCCDETDNFSITLTGETAFPAATTLVSWVKFTNNGTAIPGKTLSNERNATEDQKKQFAKNVTGFTYDEEYDFSDVGNAWLHLGNPDPLLNLMYVIYDLKVSKDIPCSEWDLDTWYAPSVETVVHQPTTVTLGPGQVYSVNLGAVDPDTYALATATAMAVIDLDTAERIDYTFFAFAETVSTPGPCSPPLIPWTEEFDCYDAGHSMHGQSGWRGWDADPTFDAIVTNVEARSLPNSLEVTAASDLVCKFAGYSEGQWQFTAWQYIPSGFQSDGDDQFAGTYLILLNTYADGGPHEESDWSVQMNFDSNDGMLKVYHGDRLNTVDVPYIPDEWIEINIKIDMDIDSCTIYYNGDFVVEYSWTGGVLGDGGGALNIGAVDLFANGSTSVYWDDLSLEPYEGNCAGDLDDDGDTDHADLGIILADWGCSGDDCAGDLDGDGNTGHADLGILLADWGCGT
jgi:hypothetical protein